MLCYGVVNWLRKFLCLQRNDKNLWIHICEFKIMVLEYFGLDPSVKSMQLKTKKIDRKSYASVLNTERKVKETI